MPKASGTIDTEDCKISAIPARIKLLREAVGDSAAHLDRQTGLAVGTTGRLERGDQRVYGSHLYRIAQATGIDVGWFYRESHDVFVEGSGTDHETQRLVAAYMQINDPGLKRDVFELIETLAKNPNN